MTRKFECKNCGGHFEADDSQQVECPQCHSDNVDIAHFKMSAKVWKILATVVVVIGLAFAVSKIKWNSASVTPPNKTEERKDTTSEIQNQEYRNETGLQLPPVINVDELVFEEKGYSFSVSVENPPLTKFYYAVLNVYDNKKQIARCENGNFKNIPFSDTDGGRYDIAIIDAATDSVLTSTEKTGFIRQASVNTKMSIGELQAKIDSRDISLQGVGENDYLAPGYVLTFKGLSADAVNIPTTLGEVFDKLENEIWTSVKAISAEYDDMNRIKAIVLFVEE